MPGRGTLGDLMTADLAVIRYGNDGYINIQGGRIETNLDLAFHKTTPLIFATRKHVDDLGIVRALTEYGAKVNASRTDGVTALIAASQEGDNEVVRFLLEYGADVNARTDEGVTALMAASEAGDPDVVRLLLEHGADVGASRDNGDTAIQIAERNNHEQVVQLLLKANGRR